MSLTHVAKYGTSLIMAEKSPKYFTSKPISRRRNRLTGSDAHELKSEESEEEKTKKSNSLDCPVCLQTCIHPVKLPCGHIFCFLCVKGAANQSRRCALCRQSFPSDFFENPDLVEEDICENNFGGDKYAWFYEGRSGWWQYDERTNKELEESYRCQKRSFELLIAGNVYIIDLNTMRQTRRSDTSRQRRIKRDVASAPKKGIAGLKVYQNTEIQEQNDRLVESVDHEGESVTAGGALSNRAGTPNTETEPTQGADMTQSQVYQEISTDDEVEISDSEGEEPSSAGAAFEHSCITGSEQHGNVCDEHSSGVAEINESLSAMSISVRENDGDSNGRNDDGNDDTYSDIGVNDAATIYEV